MNQRMQTAIEGARRDVAVSKQDLVGALDNIEACAKALMAAVNAGDAPAGQPWLYDAYQLFSEHGQRAEQCYIAMHANARFLATLERIAGGETDD